MALTKQASADELLRRAEQARQAGDVNGRLVALQQLAGLAPGDVRVLNLYGGALLAARDYARAQEVLGRAVEIEPGVLQLCLNLAAAARGLGDDAGERQALLRALAADQSDLAANIRLAQLHERLGEDSAAMARWTNVVALEASIAQMSGELAAVFDHARAYVRDFGASLSAKVEGRLDPLRAGLAPSERRRFDACIDTIFGRRRIYANECANLHFPFLPADEYFDRAHFPWLPDVEAMTEIVRSEFLALRGKADQALFQPYVELEEGTPDNKWSKLDHSRAWSACFLWRYGERIDAVCDICPQTAAMLESVNRYEMPGRGPTAFFSLLQPHTRLPAHTGVTNTRTIVHLPLIVPPHCGFRVGGETRPWEVGTAFAFDDTIEHEAWNESDEDRVVLIFDVWNPYLTEAEKTLLHALSLAMDTAGAMSGGVA